MPILQYRYRNICRAIVILLCQYHNISRTLSWYVVLLLRYCSPQYFKRALRCDNGTIWFSWNSEIISYIQYFSIFVFRNSCPFFIKSSPALDHSPAFVSQNWKYTKKKKSTSCDACDIMMKMILYWFLLLSTDNCKSRLWHFIWTYQSFRSKRSLISGV